MLVPYLDKKTFHLPGNRSNVLAAIEGYDNLTSCPWCSTKLSFCARPDRQIDAELRDSQLTKRPLVRGDIAVQFCPVCDWWQIVRSVTNILDYGYTNYIQSIVKEFQLASKDAPIRALADHIAKKGDNVFGLHYTKMEELVGAVLSEHLNCEVVHCGQTGDRGIDLLLVLSDELVPVQVKRRTQPGVTEPVDTVREMLGVMYRDGFRRSYVVTTADKHSPSGVSDASKVVARGVADAVELIDRGMFISILRDYSPKKPLSYCDVLRDLLTDQ